MKFGNYHIAKLFTYARKKKKLSTRQLGKILGVSPSTISRFEAGAILPKPDLVYTLAEKLEAESLEELFFDALA